jgi:hypothetical protein
MSIGASGRVVIEVDPELKKALHAALMRDGLTLKDWFIQSAESYLRNTTQGALAFDEDEHRMKETSNETI